MDEFDLWKLERDFWLGGVKVYERRMAPGSLMVFPAPVGILNRQRTLDAIRQARRWSGVAFESQRSIFPASEVAILIYEATAERRDDAHAYKAQCSSIYVQLDGEWMLVLHQQTPAPAENEESGNKAVSRRWHEAWGTDGLVAAYDKCLSEDFRALFFGQGWVSRNQYIEGDRQFLAAFADVKITIEETAAEEDRVFCRMRWRGRQVAPVLGIESRGLVFDVMGFAQDRFRRGKVVEHISLFDQAALIQQLKGEQAAGEG
ncbi:MAG: ester cyclase [Steroidobacteraceae bacterium]